MALEQRYEIICTRDFLDVGLLLEGSTDIPLKILARPYNNGEREYGISAGCKWYKTGKFITRSEWNKKAGDMFAPGLVEYFGLKNRVKFDEQRTSGPVTKKGNNMAQKEKDLEKIVSVNLTKIQCKHLAEYIEINFIYYLRQDEEIDNIYYLADMCEAYKKLMEAAKGEHDDTRTGN